VHSEALAMGQIADILQGRGETDEALRIHIQERLPVAQRLGDMDSVAHIRFSCAMIRIRRGGLGQGEAQTIFDQLAESFTLTKKPQRADFIAAVGGVLGQVLAAAGEAEEALKVLDDSTAACDKLGLTDQADQVRRLQEQVKVRQP
jgi:hypothetical protein